MSRNLPVFVHMHCDIFFPENVDISKKLVGEKLAASAGEYDDVQDITKKY